MLHSCTECTQRSDRFLCDLELDGLKDFDSIKSIQTLPKGSVIFQEGQTARGLFLLCQGRVRLTVCSENGRRMTLRVATAGDVLGLSAVMASGPHEVTAEALEDVQVAVVRRKDLLRFLHDHPAACMQVVNMLSSDLHVAYDRVRAVGLKRARPSRTFAIH